MMRDEITRNAWCLIEPELAEQGYELVELEYAGGSGSRVLRVYIDKAGGGITHEDCVGVSQLLSPILDMEDLILEEYVLEVSSPGVDRPVRKPADFERFAGEEIRLTTHAPLEGRKRFSGVLEDFRDGLIGVVCEGRRYEIHIENLKKANLNR